MARSVVLGNTPRCERCRLAPRWCICAGERMIKTLLAVDVLIHHREFWRPTSTGRLITRVMPEAREHVFRHDLPLAEAAIRRPDRELWILHPQGEPLPPAADPSLLQVLLLDGSWREAAAMRRGVERWGRLVSLPMAGESRYRLRNQQGTGRHSTIEALLFLMGALGLREEQQALRLQFELHVYAGLRMRGEVEGAGRFLAESPVRDAFPELIAELHRRRPLVQPVSGAE